MVLQASLPSLGQGEAEHNLVEYRKKDDTRNIGGDEAHSHGKGFIVEYGSCNAADEHQGRLPY